MKRHALYYAEQGFSVIPVDGITKKPAIEWKQYQETRADVAQIEAWWNAMPEADIGIVTGAVSGIVVVDAEKGADFDLFHFPQTPCVETGGGGRHWYFAYAPMGNAVRFAPLYDFRGDGGYVIAPPSKHRSGNRYAWLVPAGDVPFATLPTAVIPEAGLKKPVADFLNAPVGSGSRNSAATSVCGALMHRFPPQDWQEKVWPLLLSWNATQARPSLPQDELSVVFLSIGKTEMARRAREERGLTVFLEDTYVPEVEDKGDSIVVSEKAGDGVAVFTFTDIEQEKSREVDALLSVQYVVPGQEPRPFVERINILSHSAKEGLARALSKSFGKDIAWDLLVNHACAKVHDVVANRDSSQSFEEIEPQIGQKYLLSPYILDEAPNVLFGMGSSGKTFLALRMAVSVAAGVPFLDTMPDRTGNVLYVDYEATGPILNSRLLRLLGDTRLRDCPELAVDGLLSRFRYFKPPAPLPDCLPALKKVVQEHKITLILIDSAVSACGGPPEDAAVAGRYFNALNKLGVASLTITHVSKADAGSEKMAFGSVYWHNFPRNTWNAQRVEEEDTPVINVGLFHRKANEDRRHPPRGVRLYFDPMNAFIDVSHGSTEDFAREESTGKRIRRVLSEGPKTMQALRSELPDVEVNTLRSNLKRLKKRGEVMYDEEGCTWSKMTYGRTPSEATGTESGYTS